MMTRWPTITLLIIATLGVGLFVGTRLASHRPTPLPVPVPPPAPSDEEALEDEALEMEGGDPHVEQMGRVLDLLEQRLAEPPPAEGGESQEGKEPVE